MDARQIPHAQAHRINKNKKKNMGLELVLLVGLALETNELDHEREGERKGRATTQLDVHQDRGVGLHSCCCGCA